jgi:hypothetical protein
VYIRTHHYDQCKANQERGPPYPTCEYCSKYGLDCEYISVAVHTRSSSQPRTMGYESSRSSSGTRTRDTDEDTPHLSLEPTMSEWNLSNFEPYPFSGGASHAAATPPLPLPDSEPIRSQNFSTPKTAYTRDPEPPLNTMDPSSSYYSLSDYQPEPSSSFPMSLSRGSGRNQHWQERWQSTPLQSAFPGHRVSLANPTSMFHTKPVPIYDPYDVDLSLTTRSVPQPMVPSGEQLALMCDDMERQDTGQQNM